MGRLMVTIKTWKLYPTVWCKKIQKQDKWRVAIKKSKVNDMYKTIDTVFIDMIML